MQISSPSQELNSIVATRDFLLRLTDTKESPRIPGEVRREARALLRHYPPILIPSGLYPYAPKADVPDVPIHLFPP